MIIGYRNLAGRLERVDDPVAALDEVVWLDLVAPTREEERLLEERLGLDVPTIDEMAEIEVSSRLYIEDGVAFMTASLPAKADTEQPDASPVSFVIAGARLLTVRYEHFRAFETFPARAAQVPLGCEDGPRILVALLDAVIDREADLLERIERDITALSRQIFKSGPREPVPPRTYQDMLRRIGRSGDLVTNVQDSLVGLQRMLGFLGPVLHRHDDSGSLRPRLKALTRDATSLSDYADFLSSKITFVLEATLGMINAEQNAIIKIFSVVAVAFLPPTLIASIYGMNFEHMPELHWPFGYPLALGLMVLSAVLPFLYFKRRGWL